MFNYNPLTFQLEPMCWKYKLMMKSRSIKFIFNSQVQRIGRGLMPLFLLFLTVGSYTVSAQVVDTSANLVLNASLEHYYNCKYENTSSKYICVGWRNPVKTIVAGAIYGHSYGPYSYCVFDDKCDWGKYSYFNRNGGDDLFKRSGAAGFLSRHTGGEPLDPSIMGGYNIGTERKQFISGTLKDTLQRGRYYYASFYVRCNVDRASIYHPSTRDKGVCLTRSIGLLACHDSVYFFHGAQIYPITQKKYSYFDYVPQVKNPVKRSLLDTTKWIEISGYFKAEGGETQIIMGDFKLSAYGEYDVLRKGSGTEEKMSLSLIYDDFTVAPHPYLGNDTCLQLGDSLKLSFAPIALPPEYFRWSTKETGYSIDVKQPGVYWVEYDMGHTTIRDSIKVRASDNALKNSFLQKSIRECTKDSVILSLPPAHTDIIWSTNETKPSIVLKQAGVYEVSHVGGNGCLYKEEIDVRFPRPQLVVRDTSFCFDARTDIRPWLTSVSGTYDYLEWYLSSDYNDFIYGVGDSLKWHAAGGGLANPTEIYLKAKRKGCEVLDTIRITYDKRGYAELPNDFTICRSSLQETVRATPFRAKGSDIKWSTGSTDSVIKIKTPGWYKVEIINPSGCYSKDSVFFKVFENKTYSDTAICHHQELNIDLTALPFTYSRGKTEQLLIWYKDGQKVEILDREPKVQFYESGQYVIAYNILDNSFNPQLFCLVRDTFNLLVDSITGAFTINDTTLCNIDTYPLKVEKGFDSVVWGNGETGNTQLISKPFGQYSVYVARNGCTFRDTMSILSGNIDYQINGDSLVCLGNETSFSVEGSFSSVIWSDSINASSITVREKGFYYLLVSDSLCRVTDSVRLDFYPHEPIYITQEDTVICVGDSVKFERVSGIAWQLNRQNVADTYYLNTQGLYTISVFSHCDTVSRDVDIVASDCGELYIPNAFTPNGEGVVKNDYFKAHGQTPKQFEMFIFSGIGQLVFHTNDFNETWDGTINGKPAPVDVYNCVVSYTNTRGQSFLETTGVNLIR